MRIFTRNLWSRFIIIISNFNIMYFFKYLGYYLNIFSSLFYFLLFIKAFSQKKYIKKREYNIFYTYTNNLLSKFGKSLPYNLPVYDLNNLSTYSDKLKSYYTLKRKIMRLLNVPNCKQKLSCLVEKVKWLVTCKKCSTKFDFRT